MHDALFVLVDHLPLPFAGPVHDERHVIAVVGRHRTRADERRVHQHPLARAVDIHESQPMRRRQAVDLPCRPRRRRIVTVRQDRDDAATARVVVRELVGERDLGDAIAVDVVGGRIDGRTDASDQDVRRPARVLVPPQLTGAALQRDDVRLPITIQVGDDDLVAPGESGRDRVRDEARRRRSRRRRSSKSDSHDCGEQGVYLLSVHAVRSSPSSGRLDALYTLYNRTFVTCCHARSERDSYPPPPVATVDEPTTPSTCFQCSRRTARTSDPGFLRAWPSRRRYPCWPGASRRSRQTSRPTANGGTHSSLDDGRVLGEVSLFPRSEKDACRSARPTGRRSATGSAPTPLARGWRARPPRRWSTWR